MVILAGEAVRADGVIERRKSGGKANHPYFGGDL